MKNKKLFKNIAFIVCLSMMASIINVYAEITKIPIKDYASSKQHFTTVDLTGVVNRAFADDIAGDGKGGWSDQGPSNDMSCFTLKGKNDFNGIPFEIINPKKNNNKSALVLRGQNDQSLPLEATIPVNQKSAGLYFLHTSPWLGNDHPDVGQYILEYDDGTKETFEVVSDKQIFTWWGTDFKSDEATVAWKGQNDLSPVNLTEYALGNPHPEKTIKNIIAKSYGVYGYLCLVAITLTDAGPYLPVSQEINIGNPDTSDWFEYEACEYPSEISGTAIDMSHLLDAPAGKHGYLNMDGDKLYFEDGTPFKIWGINTETPFIESYENARDTAERIAQLGYNCVRFHFSTIGDVQGNLGITNIDSTTRRSDMLSPKWMDLWCYMLNELKQRGVYCMIPLAQYTNTYTNDNLRDNKYMTTAQGNAKFFDPELQEKVIKQSNDILGYINPYTGIKIGDDPANILGTFFNETSFFATEDFEKWEYYYPKLLGMYNEWLRKKYPTRDALKEAWTEYDTGEGSLGNDEDQFEGTVKICSYSAARKLTSARFLDNITFLGDLQTSSYTKWCNEVRKNGYKMLLAGSTTCYKGCNDTAFTYSNIFGPDVMMFQCYHYLAEGNGERLVAGTKIPSPVDSCMNSFERGNMFSLQALKTIYGKPQLLTEWDAGLINPFASEVFLIMPALSGLQNWYPFHFVWEGGSFGSRRLKEPEKKFIASTHALLNRPVTQAQVINCAAMVLRNDVKEADKGYYFSRFQKNEMYEKRYQYLKPSNAFLIGKSGAFVDDFSYDPSYNDNTILKIANQGNKTGVYASITNEIETDTNSQIFKVNTERTQAAAGYLGSQHVELDNVKYDIGSEFATVYLTSLTKDSIQDSDHLLLTLAGDQKNKGQVLSNTASEVISGGIGPVMIEQIKGKITLKSYDDYDIYTLDSTGHKVNKLNSQKTAEGFTLITTTRDDKALNYEIIRTNKSERRYNGEKINFLKDIPGDCFNDLGEWEYAKDKIERTYLEGFIKVVSDKKFAPSGSITRGQFVSMLVDALKLQSGSEDANLSDVNVTNEYYNNITVANCLGVALGDDNNNFRPDDPLTKQDLYVMTNRALARTLKMKKKAEGVSVDSFSDFSSVDDYAKNDVKHIIELGYYVPKGAIMPQEDASRAEAAIIIYNLRWE